MKMVFLLKWRKGTQCLNILYLFVKKFLLFFSETFNN